MHRDVLSLRLLVMQSPLQKYSETSLILAIADFRRGLGFILFTELMLRKCLAMWPHQLKAQLSAAEDMDAWDHKAFGCLFAPSLCAVGTARAPGAPGVPGHLHSWCSHFSSLESPSLSWSVGAWKHCQPGRSRESLKRGEASFCEPVALQCLE